MIISIAVLNAWNIVSLFRNFSFINLAISSDKYPLSIICYSQSVISFSTISSINSCICFKYGILLLNFPLILLWANKCIKSITFFQFLALIFHQHYMLQLPKIFLLTLDYCHYLPSLLETSESLDISVRFYAYL